jgi:hypothetical protein
MIEPSIPQHCNDLKQVIMELTSKLNVFQKEYAQLQDQFLKQTITLTPLEDEC